MKSPNLRVLLMASCFACLGLGGLRPCSAQISNGGFETGDFTDWLAFPSGVLEVSPFAHTGQYSAHFGSANAIYNILEQDVPFSVGSTYEVSMWVYNQGLGDDVLWVNDQVNFGYLLDPVSTGLEQWEEVSFTFTYNTPTTNRFAIWGRDQTAGYFVDDISIQLMAVPEPSLGLLTLAPIAWLGWLRRRRS